MGSAAEHRRDKIRQLVEDAREIKYPSIYKRNKNQQIHDLAETVEDLARVVQDQAFRLDWAEEDIQSLEDKEASRASKPEGKGKSRSS